MFDSSHISHIALWTENLDILKDYYTKYFSARAGEKYVNEITGFQSYFLSFNGHTTLEIMSMNGIPSNKNDTVNLQHLGFIHIAFGLNTKEEVDVLCDHFKEEGLPIIDGPRMTGDGYYEFTTLDPDNNRIEVTVST